MPSKLKTRLRLLTFQVTFFVEADEDCYHAWAPMLPGLHAEGTTVNEALRHARELAGLYLKTLIEDGDSIPVGPAVDGAEIAPPGARVYQKIVTVSVS